MSETAISEVERAARRLDLDWVRIGAFALLILYHVGMFYVPWEWHVKSPRPQAWLEPLMVGSNPWRLTLLFLVSGAATRFMADKIAPGRLAWSRTVRLLPPLLLGMFVIVPPQTWLQVAETYRTAPEPFGAFWVKYATMSGGWSWNGAPLVTPTWNHLWFVAYLLIYTLGLMTLRAAAPGALRAAQRGGERLLGGWGVLVWPAAVLVAFRLGLAPRFPETHAVVGDWYVHAESIAAFLFGYLFAKSDAVWAAFVRRRWPMAAIALMCWAAYGWQRMTWSGDATPPDAIRRLFRVVYGLDQWAWIVAILGFARLHLATRDGPVRRYLTEAIFPFYIVHQTATVVAGHTLAPLNLPLAGEALLVIAATLGTCVLTFELVRRVGWLRPLFGLKPRERSARRPAASADRVGLRSARENAV